MAKATGPLFSLEARGKLGSSLIYQNQRGVNIVKNFAKPANPNSAAQQASRADFSAVAAAWKALTGDYLLSWDEAITSKLRTAKAAFFSINLLRLQRGRFIAEIYPGTQLPTINKYLNTLTSGGVEVDPSGLFQHVATYDGNAVYERLSDGRFVVWRHRSFAMWIMGQQNPGTEEEWWTRIGSTPAGEYEYEWTDPYSYCNLWYPE